MKRVMVDLESLSLRPNAMILSIGAVTFDPASGLGEEFYQELRLDDQYKLGRDMDPGTVAWWTQQPEEARRVFADRLEGGFQKPKHAVVNALMHFTSFLAEGRQVDELWSRGSGDAVWLETLFEDAGLVRPWKYSAPRDCRVLDALVTASIFLPERKGTFHNALDDAKYQAECACIQLRQLGVQ